MPKRKRKKDSGSEKKIKYKGVMKRGEKYQARIFIDGKYQHLGTYDTLMEAATAYDLAAIKAECPTSKLNFLDQVPKNYKPKNGLYSNNTTGFRGVYKRGNRFEAGIRIDGTPHYIGMFGTTKEAAIAFDLAVIQAKHPTSELNFPDMIHHNVRKKIQKRKKRKMKCNSNEKKFNGVCKIGKKFRASVSLAGKVKHVGIFTKAKDAAMAYDMAIVELSGKSIDELKSLDLLNFPNGMEEE